ncbi:tetratricopeptide repeat protein, partial [Zavarzinella formosa]|uniref:tetratricopeptide repeat protein n=1 Tax=Zavarzinella formosa TaxID=360055 RepID=UPI00138AEB4F
RAFLNNGVRCVFLNACKTGLAATTGLAGHFVTNGVPIVLGWGASVADDMATQFAEAFYKYLAAGDRVPAATAKARQDIWRAGQRAAGKNAPWDATFALARLYATGPDADLIDRSAPSRKYEGPKTEPMLLGDEIKGLREGFVGRRREQQQLIPPFREGAFSVLVLTGMGGMGKSTLATRTANRLKTDGFGIHAIKAGQHATPAEAGRWFLLEKLLPALARPFMKEEPTTYEAICNGKHPVSDRVNLAVEEWSKRKLLLVMDNFEDVLNPDNTIADPDLRTAFHILTRNLTGGSRLLVTCRYRPDDTPDDLPHVCVHGVPEMREFELRKFLRREPKVEARMRSGEIKDDLIHRLHALFGGTPGFLVSVRAWLSKGDISDWEDKIPADTPLEDVRQAYCEKIMLPKLFALLSEPSQRMASLLAVSELPLPTDGLAQLAGQSPDDAQEAADEAANYGLVQRFTDVDLPTRYQTPGLIRDWLSGESRLSPPDRKTANGKLAKFWKKCYEEDREKELQVAVDVELLVCRAHAKRAEQSEEFQWATYHLSRRLERIAEWREARKLLMEIPESERDGQAWHQLASIDLREGKYAEARAGFAKAFAIRQAIGDRAGEAAAWHQLASIDVNEGKYAEARAGFAKALAINQAIGDRAGEAATWHNLASIDVNEGKYAEARAGFAKALAIKQAVSDWAGE